jgi:putative peptide zinc metalloprotease protein
VGTLRRSFLASVVSLVAVVTFAGPAPAQTSTVPSGPDNAAVAVNTKDGSSVFKLAFSVKKVSGDTVSPTNTAVAYASCADCRTVAVAIQVVLVESDATTVAPTNLAIAINDQCTDCETLALAYQYVFGTGEPIKLTPEGHRQLAEIRKAFRALQKRDDLTLQQLADAVAVLAARVADVLANETVPKGKPSESQSATSTTGVPSSTSSSTSTSEPPSTTTTSGVSNPTTSTTG